MINPQLREIIGDLGVEILTDFCEILTYEEKDSIFVKGDKHGSPVDGMYIDMTCDSSELASIVSNKAYEYSSEHCKNALCIEFDSKSHGTKLWVDEDMAPVVTQNLLATIGTLSGKLSTIDEPRKIMLVVLLHEYIALHYCDTNGEYISSKFASKCGYYDSLRVLMDTYYAITRYYGTKYYDRKMNTFFYDGHIKAILENEEFL